jgi:putative transposase
MSSSKNIRLSSALKPCVGLLRVARSGWYARRIRRLQLSPRQQFRRQCDKAVSQAFHQAKQRYGAPRITDELREQG